MTYNNSQWSREELDYFKFVAKDIEQTLTVLQTKRSAYQKLQDMNVMKHRVRVIDRHIDYALDELNDLTNYYQRMPGDDE